MNNEKYKDVNYDWIKNSELYDSLAEMYESEGKNFFIDERMFEFPHTLLDSNIRKVLDNIRFFGIEDERILYECFEFIIDYNTDDKLKDDFPELRSIFNNETHDKPYKAVKNGDLFSLMYIYKYNFDFDVKIHSELCRYGHLKCLKFVHSTGCIGDKFSCILAAENGHLECLQFCHENGCEWDKLTCEGAALNGHLECLKYAHENGCEWDEWTCKFAAKNGHLECLKYIFETACKLPDNLIYYIMDQENEKSIECLKYINEHGFPWNKETILFAYVKRKDKIFRFLLEQGCEWNNEIKNKGDELRHDLEFMRLMMN
jgi:hypothetical protein